ncbi:MULTISPECIES: hypothetical protein [unclassified Bradyrhizobium]|uniref:hypothetical protein n=1 Tax=unclassified Bradyrhizobium TaxID=2631580 RepID=UPI0028E8CE66|nr:MULTISPECIES: hypothetical protein [unclassified Bradyrhizobium]
MNQIPLPASAEAENRDADAARDDGVREIAPHVAYRSSRASTSSASARPTPATTIGC